MILLRSYRWKLPGYRPKARSSCRRTSARPVPGDRGLNSQSKKRATEFSCALPSVSLKPVSIKLPAACGQSADPKRLLKCGLRLGARLCGVMIAVATNSLIRLLTDSAREHVAAARSLHT